MSRELLDEVAGQEAKFLGELPITRDLADLLLNPGDFEAPPPVRETGWRRVLPLPWVVAVTAAAVVVGAVLGAWQARQDAGRAAQETVRLVLWSDNLSDLGVTPLEATARTLAGTVLVHQLRTPFGTATFARDVRVDDTGASLLNIVLTLDCSRFTWQGDWNLVPRSATAQVRDQPGDPLRTVPVDLVGDALLSGLAAPCIQGVQNQPTTTSSDAPIQIVEMFSTTDHSFALNVQLQGTLPKAFLAIEVLPELAGTAGGHFTLQTAPTSPVELIPGTLVRLTGTLTYTCLPATQLLPAPDTIVTVRGTDPATGSTLAVSGWEPSVIAVAVRGARAAAGCPEPSP